MKELRLYGPKGEEPKPYFTREEYQKFEEQFVEEVTPSIKENELKRARSNLAARLHKI